MKQQEGNARLDCLIALGVFLEMKSQFDVQFSFVRYNTSRSYQEVCREKQDISFKLVITNGDSLLVLYPANV